MPAQKYAPTREDKFAFGIWGLQNRGRDPFGDQTRPELKATDAIKDDVINAGAKYVDAEVVRDGNVITSRKPDDLPAFVQAIIQGVREAKPALASVGR